MSIREVTYYQVACDEPGCQVATDALGSEYSAWGDPGGAEEEWESYNGLAFDGWHFCGEHRLTHECSWCSWEGAGATPNDDGEFLCPSCLAEGEAQ